MAKTLQTNIAIGGKLNPSVANAFASITKYASNTMSSISNVNSKVASVSSFASEQLGGLKGKVQAALVTGAVASAAKKVGSTMLDQASSMEQYKNTLNIVMKDNQKAAKTFAWAVDYANSTPFETGEIVESTVKLTNYGIEAQKVLPMVGDMAGAMGKSIDQATEAIADAQTGEVERLKEFGITKEMIVAQGAKELAGIEIVNNKGQITNQEAFNKALFSLMDERYSGAMKIQSKTYKGLMSTITGVAKSGLAKIAGISATGEIIDGSAFDLVKNKIADLSDRLVTMQKNGTFDVMAEKFTRFVQNVAGGIDNIIPKIGSFFTYINENGPEIKQIVKGIGKGFIAFKAVNGLATGVKSIQTVTDSFRLLKGGINAVRIAKLKDKTATLYLQALYVKDAIIKGASTVATGLQTAAQWALNSAFLACPLTWIIMGIVALIAVFVLLWNKCEGFRNFFIEMWANIQEVASAFDMWLTGVFQTDWTTSFGALGEILNAFFYIVGSVWENIKLIFSGIIDFITGVFTGNWALAWEGVKSIFSGIFATLVDVAKAPLNMVIGLVNTAIGGINGMLSIVNKVPGVSIGQIPNIPLLAKGGIASVPSICGEAGPEAVIPLQRNNPRSIELLQKTAKIIGVKDNNRGESSNVMPMIFKVIQNSIDFSKLSNVNKNIQTNFRRNKERSLSLSEKTREALGINDKGKVSHTFVFAPNISGDVGKETIEQLKASFEEFKEMVSQVIEDKERESYA